MTNHTINQDDYSQFLRVLETTDPTHADTFNPLFYRLINNDASIKGLVERMIQDHSHSGFDGDGSKIPFANIEVPAEMGSIVTSEELLEHINERNPHDSRPIDIGAASQQDFSEHQADEVKHLNYAVASGTNTYTAIIDGVGSLIEGISLKVKFTNANTGVSTLNINGLGAKSIQKGNGNALLNGNIKAGQICHLVYTGSVFQLLGEGGEYGTVSASDVRNTKTFGTDNGVVPGALNLSNLIPSNIKKNVVIDGITGILSEGSGSLDYAKGTGIINNALNRFSEIATVDFFQGNDGYSYEFYAWNSTSLYKRVYDNFGNVLSNTIIFTSPTGITKVVVSRNNMVGIKNGSSFILLDFNGTVLAQPPVDVDSHFLLGFIYYHNMLFMVTNYNYAVRLLSMSAVQLQTITVSEVSGTVDKHKLRNLADGVVVFTIDGSNFHSWYYDGEQWVEKPHRIMNLLTIIGNIGSK